VSPLQQMRARLVPQGTADVVLLRPGSYGFLECSSQEINDALDHIGMLGMLANAGLGEGANPLEKLGLHLLVSSARC